MVDFIFPRKECKKYQEQNKKKAELITREEFGRYHQFHMFEDGPHKTKHFEERQAYGKLKDGRIIYCELEDKLQHLVCEQLKEKRKQGSLF
jgi:hypothetical protein